MQIKKVWHFGTTFHPTETTVDKFIKKCTELQSLNIRFSVGVVGKKRKFSFRQRITTSITQIHLCMDKCL